MMAAAPAMAVLMVLDISRVSMYVFAFSLVKITAARVRPSMGGALAPFD
jgi:hypothetical protein